MNAMENIGRKYILSYDVGTTGVKTCLFSLDTESGRDKTGGLRPEADASAGYGLYTLPDGGAEQHVDEWWRAMCGSTRELFEKTAQGAAAGGEVITPDMISCVSFCSQMQGMVLVDKNGEAVRHPMSYMDQRASAEMEKGIRGGLEISGMNAGRLLKSLRITGAVSGSVKDPMWKYLWVREHEPENFARAYRWLDVKEYLICRMTGEFIMTEDSAYSTMLYDTREGHRGWSEELCELFGVDTGHLAKIIKTTDVAGRLRKEQAEELGLCEGTPVFGGGGDATLIGIGTGSVNTGDTHIYSGTSGWVSTVTDKQVVDATSMIAALVGAQEGKFNYFAEMETAGKCLEWVKDNIALDGIGVYREKEDDTGSGGRIPANMYDHMSEVIDSCEPGAGGVIFTPWLHGNRCPFEDHSASGMFFNVKLETGKPQMLRAVVEGVCYHLKWMLECQEKKVKTSPVIRFCGGSALSDVTSQILADITGRVIEVVDRPQNVGSVGAALCAAVGSGLIDDIEGTADLIRAVKSFSPRQGYREVYDRNYMVFKQLYASNKKNFAALNG